MTVAEFTSVGVTNRVDSITGFFSWLKDINMMRAPRLIITGSLTFQRGDIVRDWLANNVEPGTVVMCPDDKGAGRLASTAASKLGHPVAIFPAPWDRTRHLRPNPAGGARNSLMLALGAKNIVVFSADIKNDTVSRNIAEKAYHAGVNVTLVDQHGSSTSYQTQSDPTITPKQLRGSAEAVYGPLPTR